MKTSIKIVLGVLILAALIGGYYFPKTDMFAIGTSPTGSTFSNQKLAATVFAPSAVPATTTSIFNGDSNDRYVTSAFSYCGTVGTSLTPGSGTGLASLLFKAATTSTAAPTLVTNTNLTLSVTVSTSSPDSANATSTYGTAFWQRWAAGSYMTFFSNATNTAVCTVGVNYVPS